MAFSFDGAVTNSHDATSDPITLTMSSNVAANKVVLAVFGGDSNSISLTSVTDSNSHTWDTSYIGGSEGNGNIGLAWTKITDPLVSGVDTITINYSAANDAYARAYQLSGVGVNEDVKGTKTYTASGVYSHGLTASGNGVQFEAFIFPFDFSFSAGCKAATGWTLRATFDPGSDQTLLLFSKEVTAGTNTCTGACELAYLASGVVLPYTTEYSRGQAVFVGF